MKLLSPKGMDVRPMMEVVKGAAFDILQVILVCLCKEGHPHCLQTHVDYHIIIYNVSNVRAMNLLRLQVAVLHR